MRRVSLLAVLILSALGGCGGGAEQAAARKAGQPAWEAAADPFVVAGWKSGDKASWQAQMTQRAQNQNEYLRTK